MSMSKVLPNYICPDYMCDINCRFNRCNSSRESCLTCDFNFGCLDCMMEHCSRPLFYPGNFFPDVTDKKDKEPVETQQD